MIMEVFLKFYSKLNVFFPEIERDFAISQIIRMMVTTINNHASLLLVKVRDKTITTTKHLTTESICLQLVFLKKVNLT